MIKEDSINRFLNGRCFTAVLVVFLIASSLAYTFFVGDLGHENSSGFCFPSSNLWTDNVALSMLLNLGCIIGVGIMLFLLNKTYSFVRAFTLIYTSVFFMLEACYPHAVTHLYDGTMLCMIAIGTMFILFSSFKRKYSQRSIFITFVVLSLCSMFQYACIFLIPVYTLGFFQMRAMSLKGFMALVIGLITPFWLVFGLGIASVDSFTLPQMHNVWTIMNFTQSILLISSLAVTALLTIVLISVNMIHFISYKTEFRAYNGFFAILSIATIIIMAIDYRNVLNYMPLLNCCLAVQIAQAFTISTYTRRYIAIIVLFAACVALCVSKIVI